MKVLVLFAAVKLRDKSLLRKWVYIVVVFQTNFYAIYTIFALDNKIASKCYLLVKKRENAVHDYQKSKKRRIKNYFGCGLLRMCGAGLYGGKRDAQRQREPGICKLL